MSNCCTASRWLACPVGMGLLMWFMARGQRKSPVDTGDQQVGQLRAEVEQARPVAVRAGTRPELDRQIAELRTEVRGCGPRRLRYDRADAGIRRRSRAISWRRCATRSAPGG